MANLYEITNDLVEFQEMCSDPEVELDDQAIKDTLEGIIGEYDYKVECWVKVIKNLMAEQKAVKEEAARMANRAKSIDNNINRMKNALLTSMSMTGRKSAGNTLKASIAQNGGVLPLVVDEANVPEEYQKVEVKPNNEAIRDALEHGKELSFARYGERGVHLNIK